MKLSKICLANSLKRAAQYPFTIFSQLNPEIPSSAGWQIFYENCFIYDPSCASLFLATDASFQLKSKSTEIAQEEDNDYADMPPLEEDTGDDGIQAGPVHCARCHASAHVRSKM